MDGVFIDVGEACEDEYFKEARPQTVSTHREDRHQISESGGGLDAVDINTETNDAKVNHSMLCEDGKQTTNQGDESVQTNPKSDDAAAYSKSPNRKYKCSGCGEIFKTKLLARRHVKLHMSNRSGFGCDLCGANFQKPTDYARHMYAGKCEQDWDVSDEEEACKGGGEQNSERTKKRKIKHHVCKHCGDVFMGLKAFSQHLKDIHGEKMEFKCKKCDNTFVRKENLLKHVKANQNREICTTRSVRCKERRSMYCPVCQKKFDTKYSLTMHMRLHSGDKLFKCYTCDKAYTSKQSLIGHRRSVHTDVKPILCEVCGKRFPSNYLLQRHMVQHSDKYQCRTCGKRFPQLEKLTAHTKKHNGANLFPCCYCQRKFKTKQHQIGHIRTHTGERPYQCPLCDASFTLKKAILRHTRFIHSKEMKFKCQVCDKGFKENWALNRHLQNVHNNASNSEINTGGEMLQTVES